METLARTLETEVVAAIRQEGIIGEPITVIKNGCRCTGVKIIDPDNPGISPIVYYSQDNSIQEIVEKVLAVQQAGLPDIKIEDVMDLKYVCSRVFMAIQMRGNEEDVIRKPYLNLELVLRIPISFGDQTGTIKVTKSFLEKTGISEGEIWKFARNNMSGCFSIYRMGEMLGLPDYMCEDLSMYVCTTEDRSYGATALAFPAVFRDFCVHHNTESLILLPSSIDEILILPEEDVQGDVSGLPEMVREINETTVDPVIRLEPCVYRYDMESNTVTIAAAVDAK